MLKHTDGTVYYIYWLQIDLLSSWKFYSQWQAGKLHYWPPKGDSLLKSFWRHLSLTKTTALRINPTTALNFLLLEVPKFIVTKLKLANWAKQMNHLGFSKRSQQQMTMGDGRSTISSVMHLQHSFSFQFAAQRLP